MDIAVLVSEDLVEAFGQAASAALRSCELLLASAGDAREPRQFTSAGRADDASLRVVEGKDLDLSLDAPIGFPGCFSMVAVEQ
ncbi:hypothetical protein [Brachybacterium fresconis]|uniref:Uncharacterized protein n=1 Tax=Brachybacterium fresconis TaxID=173363 RepID=A0ABS4YQU4_9MICO|nr:hypothetical protein [Brachybacterium fresconis]MBP2411168.1 hypothetical protein [Brachybacterium fresconis]